MRLFALSAAVLALVAGPAFAGEQYNKKITIGEKAPAFTGIPAYTADGKETTLGLNDLKEDAVVLVFLANHCPVVGLYEDRVNDLVKKYDGKSVKVVAVCVNDMDSDRLPAIKERMAEKGYNFSYGYDQSQAIGRAYGAVATPEFFVLDKERNVRYAGALDDNNDANKVEKKFVEAAVNAVLDGGSVEVATTKARGCGIKYTSK